MSATRVIVVDDHTLVRAGIRELLSTTDDICVVGEATNGAEAMGLIRQQEADLLLLDLSMPGVAGVDLIRRLIAEFPRLPILMLSMHNDGAIVSRILKAGAKGYVTKDCEPETLLGAIRKVARGGRFIDPALVDDMVFEHGEPESPQRVLSDREFQILQKLSSGLTLAEIAAELCLSPKTVSTHKTRLMQKLRLKTSADIIRYALNHNLGASSPR
ncbi:response regulator [Azovibrio restrictus]|uniref:response regulator n=2 Tax=Azovibrio restrictus TaxID=146938 RepID=UPI0004008D14|nr:response regulator transcription factor [Azovibrio restrictus]MCE1170666.1 response regulator transcription factor [Azovibrio sp.]